MSVGNPSWLTRRRPLPVVALSRRGRWISHVSYCLVGGWLGNVLVDQRGLSAIWVILPAMLAAFLLSGDDPPWGPVPVQWVIAAVTSGAYVVGGLAAGVGLVLLLQTAAANLMAAFVAFRLYRFRGIGGALVPRDGAEGLWLLLCAFVSVAVGVVLGAFPGTRPWVGGGSLPLSLAAVCRYVVPIVVGLMCLLLLYVRDDERLLRGASRWWLVLFVPTTILCTFAPTMIEGYPL